MKIAVINEVSSCARNQDIVRAIEQTTDAGIINIGMKKPEEEPQLTYIHKQLSHGWPFILAILGHVDLLDGRLRDRGRISERSPSVPGSRVRSGKRPIGRMALLAD